MCYVGAQGCAGSEQGLKEWRGQHGQGIGEQVTERMSGWSDRGLDGWADGPIDRQMNRWRDGGVYGFCG